MPTYLTHEASFELETSFADRTVHQLEAPLGEDATLGLWLSREPLPADGTLRDAAIARIAQQEQRLDAYAVLAEREGSVAGASAIEFSARFRDEDAMVYERQTHFASNGVWYCLTTRSPAADREICDDAMERIVATLMFRGEP